MPIQVTSHKDEAIEAKKSYKEFYQDVYVGGE